MALCGSKFCKHRSAEFEHLSGRFVVECRGNRTLLTCQCNSSGDDLVVNLIYVARASQIPCPTKICFDEFSSGRDAKKIHQESVRLAILSRDLSAKGQLISKCIFGVSNSPKK